MTRHAVVIAGGGPTGLMLAGELALARVDVAIVERRASQDLVGSRAGGLGRRMPDLDLVTAHGPLRVFTLLHAARPVLLNLGEPGGVDVAPWADRVRVIDAQYAGRWELPVLGGVPAPTAVLIRPDGHVAWVGEDRTGAGLPDALTAWFGAPAAA